GTVRSDDARLAAADRAEHPHHVEHGDPFGDVDRERQPGVGRLHPRAAARPGSPASSPASAPPAGGTKMTDAFAPVAFTQSATVLNTGQPSWVVPPFPGVTPPTRVGPDAAPCFAWNVPARPVIPCTMSRVFRSIRTAISP